MRIKWRVALALIGLCIAMILLESSITMIQLKDNIEEERNCTNAKISKQIGMSFSYISDDIEHYLFSISRSEGVANVIALPVDSNSRWLQINRFLQSITDSTDYISSAYIIEEDNETIWGYSGVDSEQSFESFESKFLSGTFNSVKDTQWFCDEDGNIFVRRAIYLLYPYRKVASVIVSIDQQSLCSMVGLDNETNGSVCIFDATHNLILDGSVKNISRELIYKAYEAAIQVPETVVSIEYGHEVYDVYVHSQDNDNWNILHLIEKHKKLESYYEMNSSVWTIGIALCIVGIFCASIVSRSLTKRISNLTYQVQRIGDGHPEKRIQIRGKDEISELADNFNDMLDKIEDMYQQVVDQSLEKEKVRYELLDLRFRSVQAQIAPHFISNLLGALNSYAVVGEIDKVEQLVVHASRFIRKNLETCDTKMRTVEDEFRTIDEYIALYQSVFGQPNEYQKVFLDEECRTMMMPSLLLQPLVENALKYYRDDNNSEQTRIWLTARHNDGNLILSVEDTSGELPQDVLDAIDQIVLTGVDRKKRLGFGLTSIIRRLKIMYQDEFSFLVFTTDKHSKRIDITIPAVKADDYEEKAEQILD